MKTALNLALLLAVAMIIIVLWPRPPASYEQLSADELVNNPAQDTPTLVMVLNPRSARNRHLVTELDHFLKQHNHSLNWAIATPQPYQFNLRHLLVQPKATLDKTNLSLDTFILFDKKGSFLTDGKLHQGLGPIVNALHPMLGMNFKPASEDLSSGLRVSDSILANSITSRMADNLPPCVWILFEDLCFTCGSGKSLEDIESLAQQFVGLTFKILLIEPVDRELLDDFIRENKVKLPIVLADKGLHEYWQETVQATKLDHHPLNGTHLFIDQAVIQFVSQNHAVFRDWLLEYKAQPIKAPGNLAL